MDNQINKGRILSKLLAFMMLILVAIGCDARSASTESGTEKPVDENEQRIMLALLLDTSNSMDGLIDQAKSQLWRIVNELASAKCQDGAKPSIQIALYEYGNDGLPSSEGYIRLVSPLTNDLDVISEKLFSLKTNGGNEYCGQVIKVSLAQLAWSSSQADLKMIFIAGNEPFTQGEIPYQSACGLAKEKNVVVNTIFCGNYDEGVGSAWKRGADLTGGTYMSIEQDRKTVYIETPYDERISALNDKLNDTYVYYGKSGSSKKQLQMNQDKNAESYGSANKVERTVSKSSHAYSNSTWDLVDAAKDDEKVITKTEEAYLPEVMKGMNEVQRKEYVKAKATERSTIQSEIQVLNEKRKQFIDSQTKTENKTTLDAVMINAIKTRAKEKHLSF